MEQTSLLISAMVFAGMTLAIAGVYLYYKETKERRNILGKIKTQDSESLVVEGMETATGSPLRRRLTQIAVYLGNATQPKKAKELSKVKKALMRCGYRKENAPAIYFGLKVLCAAICAGVFLIVTLLFRNPFPQSYFFFFLTATAVVGFYTPGVFVHYKTRIRKNKLLQNFPDAMDLLVVCVEAGMGLDSAINRVGEEMKLSNKILSEEFRLLALELRAGKARKDALKNLAMRVDLEDVNSLVTLLIQTDKFGTRVAQSLRVYSDSMRTKRYQRAEEIAAKLPVKLVLPLVFCIFPSLFIAILGPAFIQVYRNFLNR